MTIFLYRSFSPPHSPKPVTRRKNKVAPHPPPVTSHPPPVSSKQEGPDKPEKPPRPVAVITTPGRPVPKEKVEPVPNLGQLREKQESTTVVPEPKPKPIISEKIEQSSSTVIHREKIESISPPEPKPKPSKDIHRISVDLSQSDLEQKDTQKNDAVVMRPKFPTPAPRSIIPRETSQEQLDPDRTPSTGDERPKPAIPERPASLRHGSFRIKSEERDATVINDKNLETTPVSNFFFIFYISYLLSLKQNDCIFVL